MIVLLKLLRKFLKMILFWTNWLIDSNWQVWRTTQLNATKNLENTKRLLTSVYCSTIGILQLNLLRNMDTLKLRVFFRITLMNFWIKTSALRQLSCIERLIATLKLLKSFPALPINWSNERESLSTSRSFTFLLLWKSTNTKNEWSTQRWQDKTTIPPE